MRYQVLFFVIVELYCNVVPCYGYFTNNFVVICLIVHSAINFLLGVNTFHFISRIDNLLNTLVCWSHPAVLWIKPKIGLTLTRERGSALLCRE